MRTLSLSDDQYDALRDMVLDWINEGFTTPPYKGVEYDLFEILGINNENGPSYGDGTPRTFYDLNRPLTGRKQTP